MIKFQSIVSGSSGNCTLICSNKTKILIDCGIKFTVLSPFQAKKVRLMNDPKAEWIDVNSGNIDPGKAYRCFSKTDPEKYLDLFFYDGAISKSVAFDNLLHNPSVNFNCKSRGIMLV